MKILADESLPYLQQAFPEPFQLSFYKSQREILGKLNGIDILICRSTLKIHSDFFQQNKPHFIATASSGTDHIDKTYLQQNGITLLDAKGSNAAAVADYVIATVAWLQRHSKLQEGIKAGVIGAGEVGSRVIKRLESANFQTISYDPLKNQSCSFENLQDCQLICVHAELHNEAPYPSENLLNDAFLGKLSPGTVIINASRGKIINEQDLLKYPALVYCTDVYVGEPCINKKIVDFATLCTPHIAGHSIEAKLRAITQISEQLHDIYSLEPPSFPPGNPQQSVFFDDWQNTILSLYDPQAETLALKHASNLSEQFLLTRKAHQQRHEFSLYGSASLSKQLQGLLG